MHQELYSNNTQTPRPQQTKNVFGKLCFVAALYVISPYRQNNCRGLKNEDRGGNEPTGSPSVFGDTCQRMSDTRRTRFARAACAISSLALGRVILSKSLSNNSKHAAWMLAKAIKFSGSYASTLLAHSRSAPHILGCAARAFKSADNTSNLSTSADVIVLPLSVTMCDISSSTHRSFCHNYLCPSTIERAIYTVSTTMGDLREEGMFASILGTWKSSGPA